MATNAPTPATAVATPDNSSNITGIVKNFDQLFTFDGGDVEITAIFQGQRVTGKVSSQAMVLASPVFKKFIYPPWTTVPGNALQPKKSIDFTEEDGCALLILLRLVHHQSSLVPASIGLDTHLQLAVLGETYDCVPLIRLMLEKWLMADGGVASKDESGRWLYICWAFGMEVEFKEVSIRMTRTMKVIQGVCSMSGGATIVDVMPDKILESILFTRDITIQRILEVVYVEVKKYSDITSGTTIICSSGRLSCDAMVYGSLLIGLQQRGLWPPLDATQVDMSVDELATQIRELKIHCHRQTGGRSGPSHYTCCVFRGCPAMEQILNDIPTPVLDCHIIHMENRRNVPIPEDDPLMHDTLCARCSNVHSAMAACPVNEKKRPAPSEGEVF